MFRTRRVLVVEDEVITAMSLEMELEQAGYTVCRKVSTGEEAVEIARKEVPDLILMDICLAGNVDGIEAAKLIRKNADIPMIFITGYADENMESRAKSLKPLGYLLKPLKIEKLQQLIDSIETA